MEGLWTAKFTTPMGSGGGVAYFTSDKVFGGDSGFTDIGSYEEIAENIVAKLKISPHFSGIPSVFGATAKTFDLTITGTVRDGRLMGQGSASIAPGMSFQVSLTKI